MTIQPKSSGVVKVFCYFILFSVSKGPGSSPVHVMLNVDVVKWYNMREWASYEWYVTCQRLLETSWRLNTVAKWKHFLLQSHWTLHPVSCGAHFVQPICKKLETYFHMHGLQNCILAYVHYFVAQLHLHHISFGPLCTQSSQGRLQRQPLSLNFRN